MTAIAITFCKLRVKPRPFCRIPLPFDPCRREGTSLRLQFGCGWGNFPDFQGFPPIGTLPAYPLSQKCQFQAHSSTPTQVFLTSWDLFSDHGPSKTQTKTQILFLPGKEKLRPRSKFLGMENSGHRPSSTFPADGSCLPLSSENEEKTKKSEEKRRKQNPITKAKYICESAKTLLLKHYYRRF